MGLDDLEQVLVTSRAQLRQWLSEHGATSPSIWLVTYKKSSGKPSPTYDDIVEEALCFGWIDSTTRRRDDESSLILLARRKPNSTWSAANKVRLERLLPSGLMTAPGLAAIETAKANGSWELLDAVERLEMPADLATALDRDGTARQFYDDLPPGVRKQVLWFVSSAKRDDTRARRIARVATDLAAGRRPTG